MSLLRLDSDTLRLAAGTAGMAQSSPAKAFRSLAAIPLGGCTSSKWRPKLLSLANCSSRKSEKRPIGPCLNFQESVITAVGVDPFAPDVSLLLLPQIRP
ncbi:hypothetical protein ACSS6W_004025 [Trichoderma asperelloides]